MNTSKKEYYIVKEFPSKGILGGDTEVHFETLMRERGNEVDKSSIEEDKFLHIDYWVNGVGVDVKGNRTSESIWLELVNVRGFDGWLKGEAEYIAMDMVDLKCFYFFLREDLLNFVVDNVKGETTRNSDFLMFYNRSLWGNKDKIAKCKLSHIEHLVKQKICY